MVKRNKKLIAYQQVLENLLRSDDTIYVDVLNQIGFEYWTIDPSKSEQFTGKKRYLLQKKLSMQVAKQWHFV